MKAKVVIQCIGILVSFAGTLLGAWLLYQGLTSFPMGPHEALGSAFRLSMLFALPSALSLFGYIALFIRKNKGFLIQRHAYALLFLAVSLASLATFLNIVILFLLAEQPLISLLYIILAIPCLFILAKVAQLPSVSNDQNKELEACRLYSALGGFIAAVVVLCLLTFTVIPLFSRSYLYLLALIFSTASAIAMLSARQQYEVFSGSLTLLWVGLANLVLGVSISMVSGTYFLPVVIVLAVTGVLISII